MKKDSIIKKITKKLLIVLLALLITFRVFYVVHIFDVLFDIGPQIIKEQQEKEGYSELFSLASDKTHDIVKIDGSPTNSNYNYNVLDGVLGLTNIFPSELSCESYSYFYYIEKKYIEWTTDFRAEIFLECQYNEEDYKNELKRIANIGYKETGDYKSPIYVEDLFDLPAYVITYNFLSKFSYVLISEKNFTLIYIYLYDVKSEDNIVFNRQYAPSRVLDDSSFPNNLITRHSYDVFTTY